MGSLLGPVLANIIMTEFESVIVEPLIGSGKILVKFMFDKFNSFHENIKFLKDRFDDNNIHFLDITIDKKKPTHTDQYSDINSNVPWNYKIS